MNDVSDMLQVPVGSAAKLPVFGCSEKENLQQREAAVQHFLLSGFPEKNNEEYKYSPTGKIFGEFSASLIGTSPKTKDLPKGISIEFDGRNIQVSERNLLPEGLLICTLEEALQQKHPAALKHFNSLFKNIDDPLLALNIAGAGGGLFIFVPEKVVLKQVLNIIYPEASEEKSLLNIRNLYVIENLAECAISEFWLSPEHASRALSYTTEIVIEGSGRLHLYKNHLAGSSSVLFDHTHAILLGKGVFKTVAVSYGGKWIRNNLNIEMQASGAEAHLNGLFYAGGKQHVDHHTAVIHAMPHCESFQLYKGILHQQATGVFNGKILVKRDAQKTNAYQSSKNLIMGNQASVNAKPQLEIFADDVKCSHGSSTGKIDEDALFYLRCRGISEQSARRLLLDAFAGEVLDTIDHREIKDFAAGKIFAEIL